MFDSEKALVEVFVAQLSADASPWGSLQVATEFYYQRGRTDVIAYTSEDSILAFEAKLQDWREALQQAYRNRCFAHRSYVVLPKMTAIRAHKCSAEFDRRQVGICYMDGCAVVILHDPAGAEPLQPWLLQQAKSHVLGQGSRGG
jgi:hypothetical protein